jgi:hypothetical protein
MSEDQSGILLFFPNKFCNGSRSEEVQGENIERKGNKSR